MKSLPTTELSQYEAERANNDQKMTGLFAALFPQSTVPFEYIFDIVTLLESSKVNARIIPEVIRGISNISTNDRKGQVIVHVQKESTNVQIRENSDTMSTLMEETD